MKFHIVLNNFQQTEHADLIFEDGLSIIQGLNNNGKSSLIRAINAVVFNNGRKTKSYIQNGKKFCSVLIQVDGYKDILWYKTHKEVSYTIGNSQPIQKAGKYTLKDVYPEHPFTLYEDNLLFNVIKQKGTPIPFGQTSSQVFSIFEELYGILSTKDDLSKFDSALQEYNNQLNQNKFQLEQLNSKKVSLIQFSKSVDKNKLLKIQKYLKNTQDTLSKIQFVKDTQYILSKFEPTVIPISNIDFENSIKMLQDIKKIKSMKQDLECFQILEKPVDTTSFVDLESYQNIIELKGKIDLIIQKRHQNSDKIKSLKNSLPVCPTCKRPF